jgi:hypothetical protein
MSVLTRYVEAWVANDVDKIAESVAESCVITECYGPVYHGRARVREWATAWFQAGGIVHAWTITDHLRADGRESAQWVFECTFGGTRSSFEGCTISSSADGLITSLREYQTTVELYDWTGSWR